MNENIKEVKDYLDKAGIFYVTTVDGDKPKARPFSFDMVADDRIYFGVGTFKDCYRQMMANPNTEICASDGQTFIRIYGEVKFDDRPELFEQACAEADYLPKMYNEKTGKKLGMFYIKDATVEFRTLVGITKTIKM